MLCMSALLLPACGGGTSSGSAEARAVSEWIEGPVITVDGVSQKLLSDTVQMGDISPGAVVAGVFHILNGGSGPVVIAGVSTSCGCTSTEFTREPILPGGEGKISYRFDSKGYSGRQNKVITVRLSSGAPVRVILKGYVEE